MQRREVLISCGALVTALSGCTSSPEEESPVNAQASTSTQTTVETASPTATPTTPAPTATAESTETPEPTETAEPTPSKEDKAALQIEKAKTALTKGYNAYVERADVVTPNLTDVNASIYLSAPTVTQKIFDVPDYLDKAEKKGTQEQRKVVRKLRGVYVFFYNAAHAQSIIAKAFEAVEKGVENAVSGISTESQRESIESHLKEPRNRVERIRDEVSAADFDAFGSYSGTAYGRKLEQFDLEIETFEQFSTIFVDFEDAVETLESARGQYKYENYNTAMLEASQAEDDFEDLLDDIESGEFAPVVESLTEDLLAGCEKYRDEAHDLSERAASNADK